MHPIEFHEFTGEILLQDYICSIHEIMFFVMVYPLQLLIPNFLLCRYNVVSHLLYILGRKGDVKMCSVFYCYYHMCVDSGSVISIGTLFSYKHYR